MRYTNADLIATLTQGDRSGLLPTLNPPLGMSFDALIFSADSMYAAN